MKILTPLIALAITAFVTTDADAQKRSNDRRGTPEMSRRDKSIVPNQISAAKASTAEEIIEASSFSKKSKNKREKKVTVKRNDQKDFQKGNGRSSAMSRKNKRKVKS